MLTPREAFKVGFLARCGEAGLSRDETLRAVKTAAVAQAGLLGALAGGAIGVGKGVGGWLSHVVPPVALAAPPIAGGLAGYGLAKGTDVDDEDVDEVKDREVINAYLSEAGKLHRQKTVRALAKAHQLPHPYRR